MIFLECVNDQVSPCCHYCDWRGPAELLAMICTIEEWFHSSSSPDDCGGSINVLFVVVVNGDASVRHPCTQPSPTSPALISQNAALSGSVICPSLSPSVSLFVLRRLCSRPLPFVVVCCPLSCSYLVLARRGSCERAAAGFDHFNQTIS